MIFNKFYEEYFPFWNKLDDKDKEFLCQNSSIVHFEKEQMVHNNAECSGLFIVKTGKLRLYMAVAVLIFICVCPFLFC